MSLSDTTTDAGFATTRGMPRRRKSAPASPWRPSDSWIDAFARQCTEQLYDEARRFAAWRASAVGKEGGLADDYYARELVQNAFSDTLAGVLRWDPTAETLQEHVWDAIRTRTNHDRMRAKRYRHEPIDVFDPEAPRELLGEIEVALEDRASSTSPEIATLTAEWLAELREHAPPASAVGRMLDAFEAGATTMADVMHHTGMLEREYDAARLRLDRLVQKLAARFQSKRRMSRRRA